MDCKCLIAVLMLSAFVTKSSTDIQKNSDCFNFNPLIREFNKKITEMIPYLRCKSSCSSLKCEGKVNFFVNEKQPNISFVTDLTNCSNPVVVLNISSGTIHSITLNSKQKTIYFGRTMVNMSVSVKKNTVEFNVGILVKNKVLTISNRISCNMQDPLNSPQKTATTKETTTPPPTTTKETTTPPTTTTKETTTPPPTTTKETTTPPPTTTTKKTPTTTTKKTTTPNTTTTTTTTKTTTTTTTTTTMTTTTPTTTKESQHNPKPAKIVLLILAVIIIIVVIAIYVYCKRKSRLSDQPAYYNDIAMNDPLRAELDEEEFKDMARNEEDDDNDELPLFI